MSMPRRVDEETLERIAEALGAALRPGDVVLLNGEMGAGKTTFVRALARGLGVLRPERVASPTYTMVDVHEGPVPLVHVDLHRMTDRRRDDVDEDWAEGEAVDHEADGGVAATGDTNPGRRRLAAVGGALEALGLEHDELVAAHARGVVAVEWGDLWPEPPLSRWEIRLSRPRGEADVRDLSVGVVGSEAQGRYAAWREVVAKIG